MAVNPTSRSSSRSTSSRSSSSSTTTKAGRSSTSKGPTTNAASGTSSTSATSATKVRVSAAVQRTGRQLVSGASAALAGTVNAVAGAGGGPLSQLTEAARKWGFPGGPPTLPKITNPLEGTDPVAAAIAGARGVIVTATTWIEQQSPLARTVIENARSLVNAPPAQPPFPDTSSLPVTPNPPDATYQPTSGPLWGKDGPNPSQDVQQGGLGNCYFMASVAGMKPEDVKNAIKDNGDGTYTVRLYDVSPSGNTRPVFVRVTGDLPSPANAGYNDQQKWVAIMEKAYAARQGSYAAIDGSTNTRYFAAPSVVNGRPTVAYLNNASGQDVIYERMQKALAEGRPMFTGFTGPNRDGLYADHAYTVTGVRTDTNGTQYVTLRNPWGGTETAEPVGPDGKPIDGVRDGQFEMTMDEFMKTYPYLAVAGG